jgi:endonuclease YncB( thermonuclease family)
MALNRLLDKMESRVMNARTSWLGKGSFFCSILLLSLLVTAFKANAAQFALCGSSERITCVVDGDTLWLNGEKFRLQGYDTPETTTGLCGGEAEQQLGYRAALRLVELLNMGGGALRRTGVDRYGRTLAILTIDGRDIADILVAEVLARYWPDGDEFWCR